MVLVMIVLMVLTVAACVWAVLPPDEGSAPSSAAEDGADRPESLEGVLVAQMMAGEINRKQYRRAVEGLAARDDERHPMAIPPEPGPAV